MRLHTILLTALLALTVAGCGVRGNLQPPSAANAPEGEAAAEPVVTQDRDFILDGLLL